MREILKDFLIGKQITEYLRKNHQVLFGKDMWGTIEPLMKGLVRQRNTPPIPTHKNLERDAAHVLSNLHGIGPKQSRNILQELGLARYEIPLDSRVTGWLGDNLGWNIHNDELSSDEPYEFWLDRLQSVCHSAGILPTVFDAAAFHEGKTMSLSNGLTTRTGYVNRNGQVVVRNTRFPGTDFLRWIYQLGCSQCGQVYAASGSEISQRECPVCQAGSTGNRELV